jgi:hypothetical protein
MTFFSLLAFWPFGPYLAYFDILCKIYWGKDLRDSSATFNCLCWPLLAFAGLCWPLLAFAGLCWPLLAFVGLCPPLLVFSGLFWPLLAFAGLIGLFFKRCYRLT